MLSYDYFFFFVLGEKLFISITNDQHFGWEKSVDKEIIM